MADRISSLPDAALCYILSFLPTKEAVATSVLSKRWILLWQSVPTLDFDYSNDIHENNNESYSRFVHSVYTFILSRDLDQPLQRFYLRCGSSLCDTATVNTWLTAAAQLRVEHLSISLRRWNSLPSAIIRCKTLVVLKLTTLAVAASLCDFPLLKILHMDSVYFPQRKHLAELLSGSPNLEDLEMKNLFSSSYKKNEGNFKRLCKLRRAVIVKTEVPLEVVYNVKFLRIEEMDGEDIQDQIPEFYNLTHIEFSYLDYDEYGHDILQVLSHCPNLQYLSIDKDNNVDFSPDLHLEDCSCPQGVPECISLYLKTCRLVKYTGTRGEFEFAKYIMQNARVLQDMTICTYTTENKEEQLEMMKEKFEMIKQLSLCSRVSPSCKLSFH